MSAYDDLLKEVCDEVEEKDGYRPHPSEVHDAIMWCGMMLVLISITIAIILHGGN